LAKPIQESDVHEASEALVALSTNINFAAECQIYVARLCDTRAGRSALANICARLGGVVGQAGVAVQVLKAASNDERVPLLLAMANVDAVTPVFVRQAITILEQGNAHGQKGPAIQFRVTSKPNENLERDQLSIAAAVLALFGRQKASAEVRPEAAPATTIAP
jgi:hypothetical protein